jgi:hypothetical protein
MELSFIKFWKISIMIFVIFCATYVIGFNKIFEEEEKVLNYRSNDYL